jgi:2'-hydroxyisoflavone reductase
MPFTRRKFIGSSLAAASLAAAPFGAFGSAHRKLTILFLGGTGFLGPHTVRHALERGHDVTLFNRGRTNTDLFPELETIIGNRDPGIDAGLEGLKGRKWDAVIDTSGYVPRIARASSELLAGSVGQYLFVSTICQYDNWAEGGTGGTEVRPRATLDDPATEDVRTHYCALKAYCERAVEEVMPGRVTQIRPGLIVGPRDGTDRFTYWPVRIDRGGEVLAPGKPSDPTQYIDVRDLARFMVHCLEHELTNTYNAVRNPMPFGDLLSACTSTIASGAELTWVPAGFLAKHDVQPWRDVPAWADADSTMAGALTWSADRALAAGLTISPIEDTVRDTLAWFESLPQERRDSLRAGLNAEKEAAVLAAWHDFRRTGG